MIFENQRKNREIAFTFVKYGWFCQSQIRIKSSLSDLGIHYLILIISYLWSALADHMQTVSKFGTSNNR